MALEQVGCAISLGHARLTRCPGANLLRSWVRALRGPRVTRATLPGTQAVGAHILGELQRQRE